MSRTVYIETSIPSAYVTTRKDPGSLFRREVTRRWWSSERDRYDLWTSEAVILELETGDWPGKDDAALMLKEVPRLDIDEEVEAVAKRYVMERLVPSNLSGDAIHLAVSCVREVDYLLTWNIRHLANPNKADHITVINRRLGLLTPQIVTPEMLWQEE